MSRLAIARIAAVLAIVAACTPHAHSAIQNVPGCYALQFGAWSQPASGTPPARIALDTVKPEGSLISWSVDPRRVRPNIPQIRQPAPAAIWFVDTVNVLHIRWTTGYSGYELMLTQRTNGDLTGSMEAFSDNFPVPEPPPTTATVRARRIECATAGI